ncbi:MAG: plastocyanin/azurin family copper-binding protein [Salinirussus sp.]
MIRRRQILVAAAMGPLLAGCSGNGGTDGGSDGGDGRTDSPATTMADGTPMPTTTSSDAAVTVEMVDTSFDPVTAEIDAGETVAWVNRDSFNHDVTAAQFRETAADWSFSETLGGGERTTYTFDESGVYDYYCTIHGEGTMCGTVLVGGATADGSLPCASDDGSGTGY